MKKSALQQFPEKEHPKKIPITTYQEAARIIADTLNITVPEPEEITMDFINDDIFKILQYDASQFYTAETREQASQQKYAAGILMDQIRLNREHEKHNKNDSNTPQEIQKHNIEIESQNREKKPKISIQEEFNESIKEPIIQKSPHPVQQQKVEEIIEISTHPDLILLENNLKIFSWFQSTEDKKREALWIILHLIEQHLSRDDQNLFREQYINSQNWNFRIQKMSVDYTMKSITKTPLQHLLSEIKNKLS